MTTKQTFDIGDRVAYARTFLAQIQALAYQELLDRRGTVVSAPKTYGKTLTVVKVRWDDEDCDKGTGVHALRHLSGGSPDDDTSPAHDQRVL